MKNTNVFPATLTLMVASVTASGLIVYFMLMQLLHLGGVIELRFLNFLILFAGIAWLMKQYRKEQEGRIGYLAGLAAGFVTSVMASVFFAGFVYIYLTYLDPAFMTYLQGQRFGNFLTPGKAAFVIVIEGGASGACITFGLMQYYQAYVKVPKLEI